HRLRALEHRGQQDADRPGIRVAVGMAADLPVHRTYVQAGPAAKTGQSLAQRAAELGDAPAVEQDQVEFLRTLELARPPRAAYERGVDRELLAGRALGQNREK